MEISSANLNTLKELILDEQKLVTYVTVSKELCLHINAAKALLQQVADLIQKSEPGTELNINYIVSGLCDNNSARTIVCAESDYKDIKGSFKEVFFEHIYSISRGLSHLDNVAQLALLHNFDDFQLCQGLIKSNDCTKRSTDEMGSLLNSSQQAISIAKPQSKITTNKSSKIKTEINGTNKDIVKENDKKESKSAPNIKEVLGVETSRQVKTEPNIKTKQSPIKNVSKQNDINKKKGIAGFFSKQTNQVQNKNTGDVKDNVKVKAENISSSEKMEVDSEQPLKLPKIEAKASNITKEPKMSNQEMFATTVTSKATKAKTNGHKKSNETNKKLKEIKKTSKVDKKRKRLLHVSDSESEDEKDPFADDETPIKAETPESEDEIPPTPVSNPIKITSGIVNPKKRRKIVDKTYTDEEGYILTKKVEVYESCSDNEDEKSTKENIKAPNEIKKVESPKENSKPKNTKKKISPPQKGKQATMMSFFKKV